MKTKALQKGLQQLSEEGSTQVFSPLNNSDLIVGAVGQLQFDVVAYRLADEYKVEALYEPVNIYTARWIEAEDERKLESSARKRRSTCRKTAVVISPIWRPTRVNLSLMEERWPDIRFRETREH
jgi:peptide chain release factor 3